MTVKVIQYWKKKRKYKKYTVKNSSKFTWKVFSKKLKIGVK